MNTPAEAPENILLPDENGAPPRGNPPRKAPLRQRLLRALALFALGFAVGVGVCLLKPWQRALKAEAAAPAVVTVDDSVSGEDFTLTIDKVEEVMKSASDLVTTKYHYTDADIYENYKDAFGIKLPFTTDKVVFTYDGVISLGIDLSQASYDVDNEKKTITVSLPRPAILSNEIDASSFEYPYVSDSVFNATQMADYTALIDTLKATKAEEVMQDEALQKEAVSNTENAFRQLLAASELTREYQVLFE